MEDLNSLDIVSAWTHCKEFDVDETEGRKGGRWMRQIFILSLCVWEK